MPSTLSKLFTTSDISCIEYIHPWCPNCLEAATGLGISSAICSLKVYTTVYMLSIIAKRKFPDKKTIKHKLLGLLQSTCFLTFSGFGFAVFLCFFRRLFGHFNYISASFLPMFTTSIIAILMERPSRRTLLALYVSNIATETFWNMALRRGFVCNVPFGSTLIFSFSTALLLMYRERFKKDTFFSVLEKLSGPVNKSCDNHKHKCLEYTLKKSLRNFSVGVSISALLELLTKRRRAQLLSRRILNLGLFFGLYPLIFNTVICLYNNSYPLKNDNKSVFMAALLAGSSFQFFRSSTVSLYMFWKMLHSACLIAIDKQIIPSNDVFVVILYAFSTAVLFHAGVFEPQSLRKSYWKFLNDCSGKRIACMDRTFIEKLWCADLNANLIKSMKSINMELKVNRYKFGRFLF